MKKLMFLAVLAVFFGVLFICACDKDTNTTNPYQGWTMSLSQAPAGADISLAATNYLLFTTDVKNANGESQSVADITWTAKVGGVALDEQYIEFPMKYSRIKISTGFAAARDQLVVKAYFSSISSSATVNFID